MIQRQNVTINWFVPQFYFSSGNNFILMERRCLVKGGIEFSNCWR